jgi:hypothetical protein
VNFLKFKELNEKIDNNNMKEEERDLSFVGSSNTDVYIERELNQDIEKFRSINENILFFLQKYSLFEDDLEKNTFYYHKDRHIITQNEHDEL